MRRSSARAALSRGLLPALLIEYFEGIDVNANCLAVAGPRALRGVVVGIGLDEYTPAHSRFHERGG